MARVVNASRPNASWLAVIVVGATLAGSMMTASTAHAQAGAGGAGGAGGGAGGAGGIGGGGRGGGFGFDPTQLRQQVMDLLRESLGATDDEWKVIEPKLLKAAELQQKYTENSSRGLQLIVQMFMRNGAFGAGAVPLPPAGGAGAAGGRGGAGGPGGGGRGGRGGRGGFNLFGTGEPSQTSALLQQRTDDLQATISNPDAKPEEYKARLAAFREARELARKELVRSQEDLKELLTPRQEAIIVAWGVLE